MTGLDQIKQLALPIFSEARLNSSISLLRILSHSSLFKGKSDLLDRWNGLIESYLKQQNIKLVLSELPPKDFSELRLILGSEFLQDLSRVQNDHDLESALMRLALRFRTGGNLSDAILIYQTLDQHGSPAVKKAAAISLKVNLDPESLSWQDYLKESSKNFLEQAFDLKTIAMLMAGSLAYRTVRAKSLANTVKRIRYNPRSLWNTAPFALNRARALGFAAELGTFSSLGLIDQYAAQGSLSQRDIQVTILKNIMTLGVLKGGFALGRNLLPHASGVAYYALGAGTGIAGLMLSHDLEYLIGLRASRLSFADNLKLSCVTQAQLSFAMGAGHLFLGSRFALWSRQLELEVRRNQLYLNFPFRLQVQTAHHFVANSNQLRWIDFWTSKKSNGFMMTSDEDATGGGKPGKTDPDPTRKMSPEEHERAKAQLAESAGDAIYTLGETQILDPQEFFASLTGAVEGNAINTRTAGQVVVDPNRGPDILVQTDALTIHAGELLGPDGRYRVVQKLGFGGFGTVIEAWDTKLKRPVAIKVPHQFSDQTSDLFVREMARTAQLDYSQGTVVVFDLIEIAEGLKVPVLEFVPGFDLVNVINQLAKGDEDVSRAFPLVTRLNIMDEILEHVEEVHRRGIIHWDLKPENIRITPQLRVKLMDWGISQEFTDGEAISKEKGTGMFTWGYNDPSILGDRVDYPRRVDIFSLGVILYELFNFRHPFLPYDVKQDSAGLVQVRTAGVMNFLSSLVNNKSAPAFRAMSGDDKPAPFYDLEAVFRKTTCVKPEDSYSTVAEMRSALQEIRRRLVGMSRSEVRAEHLGAAQTAIDHMAKLTRQLNNTQVLLKSFSEQETGKVTAAKQRWDSLESFMDRVRLIQGESNSLYQKAFTHLVTALEYSETPEARREVSQALAELTWHQLSQNYDRISIPERSALKDAIRSYDQVGHMKDALEGNAPIKITLVNLPKASRAVMVLERFVEDEKHNFTMEPHPRVLNSEAEFLETSQGYYVLSIGVPGFSQMKVPIRITLDMVLQAKRSGQNIELNIELFASDLLGPNMIPIHAAKYYSGYDFAQGEHPSMVYSFPMRTLENGHFAISRDPVTVSEYKLFIESLLSQGKIEEAINCLPGRYKGHLSYVPERDHGYREIPISLPQRARFNALAARGDFAEAIGMLWDQFTLAKDRDPNLLSAKDLIGGKMFHWHLKKQGTAWVLQDPIGSMDLNGDPIEADFSVHSITREAAQKYSEWKSLQDGKTYRLPRANELEQVARNSFSWSYPWGKSFHPNFVLSRSIFDNPGDAFVRSVTYVPEGFVLRDTSAYGVRACIGNAREHTSTDGPERNTTVIFGGSVATPNGPFFLPSARVYAWRNNWAGDAIGAFRLVQDLPQIAE